MYRCPWRLYAAAVVLSYSRGCAMVFPVPCGTHVIMYTIRRCTLLSGLTCCLGGVNREHLSLMQPLDLIWGQHRLCPSVSEPVCSCTYLWTFLRYLTVIFTEILNDKYISVWLFRPDEWRGQQSVVSRVQSCYMLRFCFEFVSVSVSRTINRWSSYPMVYYDDHVLESTTDML